MTSDVEVVTYDGLPASAGGAHSLRTRRPDVAWTRVRRFVDACATPTAPPSVTFELWEGGPTGTADRLAAFATDRLGGAKGRDRTRARWNVREDAVEDVLAVVGAAGPDAVTRHGRPLASLVWTAETPLIDPATGAPWEGISADAFGRFAVDGYGRLLGASGIRATVGTTASSLSLWLNLPGDDRLRAAASHVQDRLPFRLSARHWRRWTSTGDGSAYRAARTPSPLA